MSSPVKRFPSTHVVAVDESVGAEGEESMELN